MTAMNYQKIRSGQILKEEPENRDLKAHWCRGRASHRNASKKSL
jgi:hypothetical protein